MLGRLWLNLVDLENEQRFKQSVPDDATRRQATVENRAKKVGDERDESPGWHRCKPGRGLRHWSWGAYIGQSHGLAPISGRTPRRFCSSHLGY